MSKGASLHRYGCNLGYLYDESSECVMLVTSELAKLLAMHTSVRFAGMAACRGLQSWKAAKRANNHANVISCHTTVSQT